jgi:predicted  nucleic acid-binding Zn-ribbon protein
VSDSSLLYRLQEIDTTWDRVRRRLQQLQKLSGGSDELKTTREKVASTETTLNGWERTQREADLESKSLAGKIQESEDRLMSGQVRNPKELESLQSSIESMRRHKSSLDEQSMEAMLKIEEFSGTLTEQKGSLTTLETHWQTKQQAIDEELQQRKKEFLYLKKLREQTVEKITPAALEQYEHLRRRKNGVAVAKLEGDICNACHMQVPTGIVGSARRADVLLYCPGCGRLLHRE